MDPQQEHSTDDHALRLVVLDEDDLSVMSAHLQDATLTLADAAFLAKTSRFALVVARIDWHCFASGQQRRRRAGFHFEQVSRVRRIGFEQHDSGLRLQLLAISFRATDAPAGEVLLTFAGGRMIKLDVACLEAEIRDLSGCFDVADCPRHQLDEATAAR